MHHTIEDGLRSPCCPSGRTPQTGMSTPVAPALARRPGDSMIELFSFDAWVRRRRRALDLTRDELAAQVGCAVATICHIETDERRPSKQLAARLAYSSLLRSAWHFCRRRAARSESIGCRPRTSQPPAHCARPPLPTPATCPSHPHH